MNQALLWLVLGSLCNTAVALAAPPNEDAQACVAASTQGQTDRDEGRLLAAREQLLACAREVCPGIVKKSCGGWLVELGERIPSVVVRVHEADQHDVTEARVTIDGRAITLDGRPVALDPGPHTLSVDAHGAALVARTFLVAEREPGRLLIVELPARGNAGPVQPAPESAADEPLRAKTASAASASGEQSSRLAPARFRVPSAAWVLGGVGVAGLVSFAVLRSKAETDLEELISSCSPSCSQEQRDPGERKALAADILLGIGIAALAGAGAWTLSSWLTHRHDARPAAQSAQLSLLPTRGGAFAALASRF